ncbi:MAG TPA: MotA/TolQ/ExbB proton channel family protein [Bacteroidia bacterium]|jgi:biopolymer transport protein ExbB|nr:MotA/TolQ/ExbB proton channel family protein [Bacteroidia bacterium]
MLYNILLQAPAAAAAVTNTVTAVADTAKAAATNLPAAAPPAEAQMNLLELIKSGGVVMYPLAILSILAVFFLIERYLYIKKATRSTPTFMDTMKDFLRNNNIDAAKSLCKNTDTPVARIVGKGVNRLNKPIDEIESSMENAGRVEAYKLERNLNILGIIAGIAPMFGFVGTILGVIKIFYNISLANNISIGLIAGGLYEKMITSATGLAIGIFAFISYHWLNVMVNKAIQKIEVSSIDFVEMVQDEIKK